MNAYSRTWLFVSTAGVSVAGLMLSEAVVYAGIAGLLPPRALLGAIAGGLAYAALGRSRFAIIVPKAGVGPGPDRQVLGLGGQLAAGRYLRRSH